MEELEKWIAVEHQVMLGVLQLSLKTGVTILLWFRLSKYKELQCVICFRKAEGIANQAQVILK